MEKFFKNRIVSGIIVLLIVLGVILSIFPPDNPVFQKLTDYTARLILTYVFLGLFFLMINNNRLLLFSFLAAGILSFFLKSFSNENLNFPKKKEFSGLSISNYNLINLQNDFESFLNKIKESNADIISFQEFTPGWSKVLKDALGENYKYSTELMRIDAFGKMIFFKEPFLKVDTFYYNNVPNLDISIRINGNLCHLISTQIVPPFKAYQGLSSAGHLQLIRDYISELREPVILAGEFNQVYWSAELRGFIENTKLENSRRFISTFVTQVPYEHMFFSKELECTGVKELNDGTNTHIGMEGEFQFKSTTIFSGSTSQFNR